jgi:transcriptional regulator with PAS, ATPase and Fis domain
MPQFKQSIEVDNEELYEIVGLRKDGSKFPAEVRGKSIPYHGEMVRIAAVRDITERKLFELEQQQANAYLNAIIDNLVDGLIVTDAKGWWVGSIQRSPICLIWKPMRWGKAVPKCLAKNWSTSNQVKNSARIFHRRIYFWRS